MKIHLDAGHYGKYNRSPVNNKYYESEMNWKLTNYLTEELERRGIEVTKSRSDINKDLSLEKRGLGAKGCDMFISIHSNASSSESTDYPIVIYGYDKTQAKDLAQKLSNLIHDLMNTKQAGKTAIRKGNNGEYYGVLRGARAAGLTYYYIIEHSFHTNKKATEWLLNDNNLKKLASEEAKLIADYFNIKKDTTPVVVKPSADEIYRVRKTWNDSKSQIGAYRSIVNAQKSCKEGYSVFDSKGNVLFSNVKKTEEPAKKSNTEVAKEVIAGKWGNGAARKKNLEKAGYNYNEIQKLVNQLLKK